MLKMYQYRLYPTKRQITKFNQTLEECRWLYNHLLEMRKTAYERIAFRRDNFTHQQSRRIVDRFGMIAVEDLHVNRMVHNHCLAKSIADAAWSGFFTKLFAKAEEAGRTAVKVNPAYTSQECSRCHHRQKMPLSERTYHCPCCLLSIDRDLNAAINILAVGLHSRVFPEAPS